MSTVENVWDLIASGDLFSDQKLSELKLEYSRIPPGQGDVLTWLVKNKEITEYHSKVFEAGHSGPFRYGEYLVNDRIIEGFFKGGFRAQHAVTKHPVILSFVTGDDLEEKWPTMKAAAHTNIHFASPFIVRCFEADENDDFKFLVYEDFDAKPITAILAKNGHLKPKTACDVIRRIALALQTIHQAGYAHGHVSSKNVRVKSGNIIKLFFDPQFQFVPLVKANTVPDAQSLLQVDYAAPELGIPGNRPDELTDIYALGCLFYELLSGKPPFPIGNIQDRIHQHATQRVKPLENLGYDKNLAQFVYFMMAKDRALRFQSVADVIKQLNALPDSGNPKPISPSPPETFLTFDKHVRAKIAANDSNHANVVPPNLLPAHSTALSAASAAPSAQPAINAQAGVTEAAPSSESAPLPASGAPATTPAAATMAAPTEETSPPAIGLQVGEEATSTTSSFRQRQKSSLKKTLIPIGITLLVLAIPAWFVYLKYGKQLGGDDSTTQNEEPENKEGKEQGQTTPNGNGEIAKQSNDNLIPDDQRTLWESPTAGAPIDLKLTPPGMRLLLSVRGESLFANDTESLLVKSLGPKFQQQTQILEDGAGISWKEANRVNFSVHDNNVEGQDQLLGAFVVEPVDQKTIVYWLAKWGDCTKQETPKGEYYVSTNGWAYYSPDRENITRFLMAPESLVKEVVENGAALLSTGLTRLLKVTDQDRHLNLVVVPTDLASPSGVTMFDPNWMKLLSLMSWYMGGEDKIQAAFMSLHFDGGDVYLETGLNPQLDIDPFALGEELRERLAKAPTMVDDYMLDIDADRHWKKLARKIPDWVKSVSNMSRVGVEEKITLANCWQPASAPHNLLAGLEYTLSFASGSSATTVAVPEKKTPANIEELLQVVRTIEIANDDLNIAVDKIVGEVKDDYPKLPFDFQIRINGTHLMDDGITKNQRLVDFKVENKPLGDILAEFVFQANPDKTSTGPQDPKTKLIWVIHEPEPNKKQVLITTRKAAAREGYKLPKQFVPE